MASCWFEGRGTSGGSGADAPHRARGAAAFENHVGRIADYLWVAEDGMKMNGYVFIPIVLNTFIVTQPTFTFLVSIRVFLLFLSIAMVSQFFHDQWYR